MLICNLWNVSKYCVRCHTFWVRLSRSSSKMQQKLLQCRPTANAVKITQLFSRTWVLCLRKFAARNVDFTFKNVFIVYVLSPTFEKPLAFVKSRQKLRCRYAGCKRGESDTIIFAHLSRTFVKFVALSVAFCFKRVFLLVTFWCFLKKPHIFKNRCENCSDPL